MPLSRIKRIPIEERDKYNMPWLFPASWEETVALRAIRKALRDPDSSNETIFELYRKIPAPRIGYLDRLNMERLITRLMTVPLRDQVSMLRYLTLIEDLKTSNISITRNEWNQASSFVTKSSKYITISELRVAFEQWTESERDYKVPADVATFNILLDSASKSNHQGLAQSILKEMRSRKMKFDRYTFTTLMMYHGSIRDVDNIHRVYKALVDAGEVVDTVVLNTLMTALVMAGEVSSAERIYAFMRRAGAATTKNPTPSMMTWKESRSFGQKLKRNAMQCMLEYVGALNVPLGPDIASFHLFIHYHCRMANWTRAQEVIRDLKTFGLTVDSCVYLSLLKGFAWFGSTDPYCEWNRERLDLVLDVVLDEEKGVFKWDRVTTVWVVRAVAKVYADSVSMEKVWDLIEAQRVRQGGKEPDFAVGVYVSSLRVILEDEDKLRQTMGQEVA